MSLAKKNKETRTPKKGIPIPAGTEQETGLTRGETEKVTGPVKPSKAARNLKKNGKD